LDYSNAFNLSALSFLMQNETKISAGSYELNQWLHGGYEKDIITTIYGPSASGKTNICLLAAVSQGKKGNKVIYIDTEGGFSIDRIKQVAGEDYKSVLDNILLLKPTTFCEQKSCFSQLLKELKEQKFGLIIIDGMTMLYRLEIAEAKQKNEDIKEINSQLATQMRILAEIARKRDIPVIVTNQVYSEFLSEEDLKAGKEKQMMMVGGDILKYWSKCIIELQNKSGRRKAILKKHRSLPEKTLDFEITNQGIKKRGWI
jgi:DNA repair protein RadB